MPPHGDRLSCYRLDRLVGRHPRPVWSGVDTRDERAVRVTMLPHLDDPAARERLDADITRLRQAANPAIVTYDAVEQADGVCFVCCEAPQGTSLAKLVPTGGFELERLLAAALTLTDALRAAHQAGVTHRELTPGAVYFEPGGHLRIHGFGLSDTVEGLEDPQADPDDTPTLTSTHEESQDLAYLAPEQVRGLPLSSATDVYSAGALLHWMATGTHPFEGESTADVYVAVLRDTPRPIDQLRKGLPDGLASIVNRCMNKSRDRRFPGGAELHAALSEIS